MERILRDLVCEIDGSCVPLGLSGSRVWWEEFCIEATFWKDGVFQRTRSKLGDGRKIFRGLPNDLVEKHILP